MPKLPRVDSATREREELVQEILSLTKDLERTRLGNVLCSWITTGALREAVALQREIKVSKLLARGPSNG